MAIHRTMFAGAAAMFMLMGFMLVMVPQQASASPNPVPALTLKLDPSNMEAVITESSKDSVEFTGSVKVDKLPVERIVVQLSPTVEAGWASSCSPSAIVVTDTNEHTFSVTVIVPENQASGQIGTLTVDATGRGGGFTVTQTTKVIVTVRPYYRLMIESDVPYREISPGSQAFFSFKVWNVGNAVDSFELEIVNLKDLVGDHWTVTLSTTQVAKIPVNEYRTVRITAQSPRDWTIWKSRPSVVTVKATSLNAKETQTVVTQSYPMYAYEKGFYIPGFDPAFLMVALGIGAVFVARIKRRQ